MHNAMHSAIYNADVSMLNKSTGVRVFMLSVSEHPGKCSLFTIILNFPNWNLGLFWSIDDRWPQEYMGKFSIELWRFFKILLMGGKWGLKSTGATILCGSSIFFWTLINACLLSTVQVSPGSSLTFPSSVSIRHALKFLGTSLSSKISSLLQILSIVNPRL